MRSPLSGGYGTRWTRYRRFGRKGSNSESNPYLRVRGRRQRRGTASLRPEVKVRERVGGCRRALIRERPEVKVRERFRSRGQRQVGAAVAVRPLDHVRAGGPQ